jgi:nicotinamidase-related amidase
MSIRELLNPRNSAVIFIDFQPQMTFGVANIDRQTLFIKVPVVLTTVESESFSGYLWPQLLDIFPNQKPIERTSMNSWEDQKFVKAVQNTKRKKLVIAALWTEVCLAFPALEALDAGYEVYAVADASGGTSQMAHDYAMQRMIQAGVVPVTWQQVLLEYQRDWARKETYNDVMNIVKAHSGAYGQGVEYAYTIVHKQKPSRQTA